MLKSKVGKEKFMPFNLQFFADGNEQTGTTPVNEQANANGNEDAKNSQPRESETKASTQTTKQEKLFNTEQVNEIIMTRLAKENAKYLRKLGVESEEQLSALLEKGKNYDTIFAENESFKAEKIKQSYMAQLSDVKENYVDLVYSALQPKKDEKVEDYKNRVVEYLGTHEELKKVIEQPKVEQQIVGTTSTNVNLNGKQTKGNNYSLADAIAEANKITMK